jgi:hypothetical protein
MVTLILVVSHWYFTVLLNGEYLHVTIMIPERNSNLNCHPLESSKTSVVAASSVKEDPPVRATVASLK